MLAIELRHKQSRWAVTALDGRLREVRHQSHGRDNPPEILTALTVLSTLEMARNLMRRVRHLFP